MYCIYRITIHACIYICKRGNFCPPRDYILIGEDNTVLSALSASQEMTVYLYLILIALGRLRRIKTRPAILWHGELPQEETHQGRDISFVGPTA